MGNFTIPKNIKIGGRNFSVTYPHLFKERSDVNGNCWSDTQQILISNVNGSGIERPFEAIVVDLIHEVLHGIAYVYGPNNRLFGKTHEEEEKVVSLLSEAIFQVLIDNNYLKVKR